MLSIIRIIAAVVVAAGATVGVLVATGTVSLDQIMEPMRSAGLIPSEPSVAGKSAPAKTATAPAEEKAAAGKAEPGEASPQTSPAEVARELTPKASKAGSPPTFDVVRVEPNGDTVAAGGAEPGAIIALLSNGEVVGKGVANAQGQWAIVLEKPLAPGDHELSVSAEPAKGGGSQASKENVAVAVPEKTEDKALVVMTAPDQPTKVLQMPEPKTAAADTTGEPTAKADETAAPVTVVSRDGEAADDRPALTVEAVEAEKGTLYVAGTGAPGGTVRIYVDDEHVGDSKVGSKGRWLLKSARALAPGRYGIRVDQIGGSDGSVIARAVVSFERGEDTIFLRRVAAKAEGASANGSGENEAKAVVDELPSVIIRPGDNLWRISQRLYGEGIRYTTIYQANKEQIGNPNLIYPGQIFITPAGDKNWTN